MRVILASGSPRRRELLQQVGIAYEVIPSDVDETIDEQDPVRMVEALSERKARYVAEQLKEENDKKSLSEQQVVVLGADTVVAQEGIVLGKPKDEEEAFAMLSRLQGTSHTVHTGVCLAYLREDKIYTNTFHETTKVMVYPMTDEEIRAYIATKDPMDKAGAYGIQGAFAANIQGIEGDYYNVVGLPIGRVVQELKKEKSL